MLKLFTEVSSDCSRMVTRKYSTSFNSAIQMLHKDLRTPIYNIYGFVRLADEIVDTFHEYDKSFLLRRLKEETYYAIEHGISSNPLLNSFQKTVNEFDVELPLIHAFFESMEMDLHNQSYNSAGYKKYIYGSAEVVGLMCLHVFCGKDKELYECLKPPAQALGAAFQKINFLRDIKADYEGLHRIYFPGVDFMNFSPVEKLKIEKDIQHDFALAFKGIKYLPVKARFGVYVAYKYYLGLFRKIKRVKPQMLLTSRIRIGDYSKALILLQAGLENKLNRI